MNNIPESYDISSLFVTVEILPTRYKRVGNNLEVFGCSREISVDGTVKATREIHTGTLVCGTEENTNHAIKTLMFGGK